MQAFRSHAPVKAKHQALCTTGCFVPVIHFKRPRGTSGLSAVSEGATGNGKVRSKQLKFFYFDPNNPEEVRELYAQHREHHSPINGNKTGSNNGSHGNGNGYTGNGANHSNGHSAGSHSHGQSPSQLVHVKDTSKELGQLQRLNTQLEEARSTVVKMQQYELMYKESRIRSKQMQVEVSTLQQLLADKDSELARQYKRMEVEASERSGLRTQFGSAVEEVKALRNELEEARQAMLELRSIIPANVTLRRGLLRSAPSGYAEEIGGYGSSPDVLSSLQDLAKQLAEGMEHEVGSLFGSGVKRDA